MTQRRTVPVRAPWGLGAHVNIGFSEAVGLLCSCRRHINGEYERNKLPVCHDYYHRASATFRSLATLSDHSHEWPAPGFLL